MWSVWWGVLYLFLRALQGALLPAWAFSHWPVFAVATAVLFHGTQPLSSSWQLPNGFLILAHPNVIFYVHKSPADQRGRNVWGKTVFGRSNTAIVDSNPTRGMDVCVRLFCVYVVLCVDSGLATGWSPFQGVTQTVCRLINWKSGQGPQGLQTHRQMDGRMDGSVITLQVLQEQGFSWPHINC
jgi:hypothetical protein